MILDLGLKLKSPNLTTSERFNYIARLEAIRDYCTEVVNKSIADEKKNQVFGGNKKWGK